MGVHLLAWILLGTLAGSAAAADSEPALTDLQQLEELRARFNQDQGHPRLLLLFSPT
ncbi:MAG TPA: hypothetical protein VGB99_12835 [Acidobacteriota bacterium]